MIILKTQLSIEEGLSRFDKMVPKNMFSDQLEVNNIRGSLRGHKFRLYKQSYYQRNAFSPVITGEFFDENERTIIKLRTQAPLSSVLFTLFACSFLVFGSISSQSFAPICFCVPIITLVFVGYLWGKSDEEYILSFILITFEAHIIEK